MAIAPDVGYGAALGVGGVDPNALIGAALGAGGAAAAAAAAGQAVTGGTDYTQYLTNAAWIFVGVTFLVLGIVVLIVGSKAVRGTATTIGKVAVGVAKP